MRLGARWGAGTPPHPGVPGSLHAEIAAQEARHAGADSWTLTWLEGRPRCQLDAAVIVTLDPSGDVAVEHLGEPEADDDDWLA